MNQAFEDPRFSTEPPAAEPERKGRGCLFWGCLISGLLMLTVLIGLPLLAYFSLKGLVENYTADAPAEIEVVELPEEEFVALEERFDTFATAVKEGEPIDDLELTAEEVNALIGANPDLAGRVLVRIEDGQVGGDVSIPLDGFPMMGGRFLNASVDFAVSMERGNLVVTLVDGEVNGSKIPQQVLDGLATENLAKDIRDDPEAAQLLDKFESLRVEGDRILLTPRRDAEVTDPADTELLETAPAE